MFADVSVSDVVPVVHNVQVTILCLNINRDKIFALCPNQNITKITTIITIITIITITTRTVCFAHRQYYAATHSFILAIAINSAAVVLNLFKSNFDLQPNEVGSAVKNYFISYRLFYLCYPLVLDYADETLSMTTNSVSYATC